MATTRLSSKGQIVLPRSIRSARNWKPGLELTVEDTSDGVVLRPLKPFAATRIEDVSGSTSYRGRRRSIEEMNDAILAEARKRR